MLKGWLETLLLNKANYNLQKYKDVTSPICSNIKLELVNRTYLYRTISNTGFNNYTIRAQDDTNCFDDLLFQDSSKKILSICSNSHSKPKEVGKFDEFIKSKYDKISQRLTQLNENNNECKVEKGKFYCLRYSKITAS